MKNLVLTFTLLFLAIPCKAETIIVDPNGSADFNNIQDAIDWSLDGDVVEVRPGTYQESINFYGKAIIVTSIDPNDPNVVDSSIILANLNWYTVRFDSGEGPDSVLTGFTLRNDNHQAYTVISCYYSSPLICKNAIVASGNSYGIYGEYAFPIILRNRITADPGTNDACAIYNCDGEIRHCRVKEGEYGLEGCDGLIANCIISDALYAGLYNCNGLIVNSTIINISQDGMRRCRGEIKNCIIVFNGCYGLWECRETIKYNNVWGNLKGSYSQGTVPSPTDIHLNPHFVNFEKGDYHLKSGAGRWDANSESWVQDDVNSLCIDAGDPNSDWTAELWPHGKRINMGAYGGTPEASMSPSDAGNIADLNNDDTVDFADMIIFVGKWLSNQTLLAEDLNRDRIVNFKDFAIFADNWPWEE